MGYNWLRFACIALVLAAALPPSAQSGLVSSGTLVIGMAPVDIRREAPDFFGSLDPSAKLADVIAKTVSELLPNYVQRVFQRSFDRPVSINPIDGFQLLAGNSVSSGSDVIIMPSILSMGGLGVKVLVRVAGVDRRTSRINYTFEDFLLLPPTSNYGEMDTKLSDLVASIARRTAASEASTPSVGKSDLPRGVARFYCVSASEPENQTLQQLGRTLTLEFPFHLAQAARARDLDLTISGLDFKEALGVCRSGGASGDTIQNLSARVETFSWDGTLSRDRDDPMAATLAIRVSDNLSSGNYRRLRPVKVREGSPGEQDQLARSIIDDFVEFYRGR